MTITVDIELSQKEIELLGDVIKPDQKDLATEFSSNAKAASMEYVHMILGQKVFTRMSDVREYRLFLIIKECLDRRIPDDQTVSDLFQLTPAESKGLVRSVLAKYQYELKDDLTATLKEIVQNMTNQGEGTDYTVTINSVTKVEELNRKLMAVDGTLHQVSKKPSTVSTYIIKPASYKKLQEIFGLATVTT